MDLPRAYRGPVRFAPAYRSCEDNRNANLQLPLSGELAALECIDSASHYPRRITNIWAPVIKGHPHDALARDLLKILGRREESGDAAVLAEPARRPRLFAATACPASAA